MNANNLGLGVMIQALGGNEKTVKTVMANLNKEIESIWISDDELHFLFKDKSKMKVFDGGQSCCEHRYMVTDDDLMYYTETPLLNISVKDAPEIEDQYGVHEVQFLVIETGKGAFTISNHNEHNGYYGGFWMVCEPE